MIRDWFCCLPSDEKIMLFQLIEIFGTAGTYILKSEWDLYWSSPLIYAALKRAENMAVWASLTEGTAIIGAIPVDVLYLDLVFMFQVTLVALSPAGLCIGGCFITEFMRSH